MEVVVKYTYTGHKVNLVMIVSKSLECHYTMSMGTSASLILNVI